MKICPKCSASFENIWSSCPYDGLELQTQNKDPLIGKVFADQYEIISVLGTGGMSVVYKARHNLMDRIVAIKLLHGQADHMAVERFKQEAKAASSLNHPNIISVYDFGMVGTQAYLVMDCIDGTNLNDVLEHEKNLPPGRAVPIFRQTCEGLEHAHKKGIVHRDLKPSNICLVIGEDKVEHVKIVDFGIAKLLPQQGKQQIQLTQTGEIFGSPMYMSPEQCLAQPLDVRSDIYSLGCLMYESLTGIPPLLGETAYDTMTMHVNTMPAEFAKVAPHLQINKSIEALVFRCLEKKPEERYQTVSEVLADLPSIDAQSGSLKVNIIQHPTKQRREIRFLRYGFFSMMLLFFGLFLYMSCDNGPNNDRGTVLEKTIWNAKTTTAQSLINGRYYQPAQSVLSGCETTARERFSNKGRLLTALLMERELFKKARMFEELEAVNNKIENVNEQVLLDSYNSILKEIGELGNKSSPAAVSVNKIMAPITFDTLTRVAKNLSGHGMDEREENLLLTAKKVYVDLLGPNDVLVANLDVLLADCYQHQQQLHNVRPLLLEASTIYEKSTGITDKRTILSIMKLGQIDRDENRYDLAKVELTKALNEAEKHFSTDKYLMFQCLGSYACYLEQTGHAEEAKQVFARAQTFAVSE